ncbi:LLM class flavin-dependent oxidoreductase [Variovorax sp. HJSM1_2]|uniref:LLM class flavin-dependent oxidoreductase n=1 Tax=Variovorax sp. HJSM1_2 TaxID=3366263 RepID=UPI003BE3ED8B
MSNTRSRSTPRQMHLALYLSEVGSQLGAWRHPLAGNTAPLDWRFYKDMAQKAERACLDMIFLADKLSVDDVYGGDFAASVSSRALPQHAEPLSVMASLVGATSQIGLAATVSATYSQPYTTARMLATIDHLSGGRVGWNVVTSVSDGEARNYGQAEHLGHDPRYDKAQEFVALVKKLWDSWEDNWLIRDQASGIYGDASKVHRVDHNGAWFKVRGPLNVPRPPQGHPVQIQAGVSSNFERTALEQAEVIFAVQPTLEKARDFYARFKQQLETVGRSANSLKVLPGIVPIVGHTRQDALDLQRELNEKLLPQAALSFMSASMNHDLAQYELHAPVPDIAARITGSKGRFQAVLKKAQDEKLTLAQLGVWYAQSLSFFAPLGTAEEVAEQLITWFEARACDGFVVLPAIMPLGANDFLEKVVPLLQQRGAFRKAYPGTTLRDTLGLQIPPNQFAAAAPEEAPLAI